MKKRLSFFSALGLVLLFLMGAHTWIFVPTGGVAWTPLSIGTLRSWGDCSDAGQVTTSGSNITQVVDKSSNAYVYTNNGTPTWQANVQNGLHTCRFASSTYLLANIGTDITAFTACAIVNLSAKAQFDAVFGNNSAASNSSSTIEVGSGANQWDVWKAGVGATAATGGGSLATSTWYRLCFSYDQATPLGHYFINNVSTSTTTSASMFLKAVTSFIGSGNGFTSIRGDIGEWVIAASVLSGGDMTSLDSYWTTKWGL